MRRAFLLTGGLVLLAACAAETTEPGAEGDDPALTKDEARGLGKTDWPVDYCEWLGWYGDGICDDFCPEPDPDCGYDPCEGLSCGDTCNVCPPRDDDCYETAVVKQCQPDGSCGPAVAECEPAHCTPGDDSTCAEGEECVPGECYHWCTPDEPGCCDDPSCQPVETETTCGGLLGALCADDEWCDYDESLGGACGIADGTGTCRPRPDACIELYSPVCGCDGNTYGNACDAHAAGVDVASEGECEPPPPADCRESGCGEGRYCTWCWGTWQCIPEGAVC